MSSHIVVEDFGGITMELDDESGNTVVKSFGSEGFSVLTCNIISATSILLGFCEAKDGESRLLCPVPGFETEIPAPDCCDSVRHCRS